MGTTITSTERNNMVFGRGAVYLNYGESDEVSLGLTKDKLNIEVTTTFNEFPRDGAIHKEIGMAQIQERTAHVTITVGSLTMEMLKLALPGCDLTSDVLTCGADDVITTGSYYKNVVIFATDNSGAQRKITLYNVLNKGNFSLPIGGKEFATLTLDLHAHTDGTVSDDNLFKVEKVTSAAPNLTALTISSGTLVPAFSGSTYTYGASVTTGTTSITVTPTCATADSIKVNGTTVASGVASGSISLSIGVNTITVTTIKTNYVNVTYTLTIIRAAS